MEESGISAGQLVAVILGLCSVITTLAGLYAAELRRGRDVCCAERDRLRDAADKQLEEARQRDEEERRSWRDWQARQGDRAVTTR
jgi:hypothetical protein